MGKDRSLGTSPSLPMAPLIRRRLAPTTLRGRGCRPADPPTQTPRRVPASARSCHPMSGECSCLPGWAGLHCNESCPQDTHGPGCQEHCLCLHGGVCQPDSGLCRCAPGYTVRRAPKRGRCGERPGSPPAHLMSAPPAFRARTALASALPTPMASIAPRAAPAKMPSPARRSTAPASARKVMGWGLRKGRFGGGAVRRRASPRVGAGQE